MINDKDVKRLSDAALEAMKHSYSPYSDFSVGAAILCSDGSIYSGTNIENASFPAGICAERSALAAAVSAGHRDFEAIAVCGGKNGKAEDECPPCGICRQMLSEFFSENAEFILISGKGTRKVSMKELLPLSFGKKML
ncbi:MAG: cytidine deaminase [Ruminococcaceae bacterium]|nr:cytidine deaminase [Oscillospiraceae bacterium]